MTGAVVTTKIMLFELRERMKIQWISGLLIPTEVIKVYHSVISKLAFL